MPHPCCPFHQQDRGSRHVNNVSYCVKSMCITEQVERARWARMAWWGSISLHVSGCFDFAEWLAVVNVKSRVRRFLGWHRYCNGVLSQRHFHWHLPASMEGRDGVRAQSVHYMIPNATPFTNQYTLCSSGLSHQKAANRSSQD